ncbi:uncharacterized protein METZ01_LOCUS462073, partial [marine metagenome]
MHIGLFTQNYLRGGLDTFLIELINNWPNKEDNITLFCNEQHPGIKYLSSNIKNKNFKLFKYNFLFYSSFIDSKKSKTTLLKKLFNIFFYSTLIVH